MGVFKKIKARRAEKKARENINWDNPTQPTKRGYKQNGFDAGEGTGSQNPNKGSKIIGVPGGENQGRTPQKTVTVTPKKVTKIDAPKSKAPEVKRSTPKAPAPTDTRSPRQKREDEFNAKKKKSTITKDYSVREDKPASPGSKNTKVVNKDATSKSGVKTYYTQAQLDRKHSDIAKKNKIARNAAIKAGATTYTMINKDGTKKKVGLSKPE
jgi:hypothetical protein